MTKFQEQLLTALHDISNSLYVMAYPSSDKDENKDQVEFDFNKEKEVEVKAEGEVKTPPVSLLAATLSLIAKEKEKKQAKEEVTSVNWSCSTLEDLIDKNTKSKEEKAEEDYQVTNVIWHNPPLKPPGPLANENRRWKEEDTDGIKFYFLGNPTPTKLQIQRLEKQYQRTYCALRCHYTATLRKEAKEAFDSMQGVRDFFNEVEN